MKKILCLVIAGILLLGVVGCSSIAESPIGKFFGFYIAYAQSSENTTVIGGDIMTVFYVTADEEVLFWFTNTVIVDNGDGTWNVHGDQGMAGMVNQSLVSYGLYKYQVMPGLDEATYYLSNLGLEAITWQDLPHSQHIGKLVNVNPSLIKPATVTRKYLGVTYDVPCLVSQTVVDMWMADTLNIGDYVIVSFIDEIPDTDEVNLAIVVDKVYESWGS